jgi:hypothetical protein
VCSVRRIRTKMNIASRIFVCTSSLRLAPRKSNNTNSDHYWKINTEFKSVKWMSIIPSECPFHVYTIIPHKQVNKAEQFTILMTIAFKVSSSNIAQIELIRDFHKVRVHRLHVKTRAALHIKNVQLYKSPVLYSIYLFRSCKVSDLICGRFTLQISINVVWIYI